MIERNPELFLLIGVPGCGKTWTEVKFINLRERACIIPSSNREDTFVNNANVKIVTPYSEWIDDVHHFKENRKIQKWRVPDIKTFKGAIQIDVSPAQNRAQQKAMLEGIMNGKNGFTDGILIFDDFKNLLPSKGILPMVPAEFIRDHRKLGVDIILAAHGFSDVNAELIDFNIKIGVFRTKRPPNDNFLAKLQPEKVDEFLEMIKRVNNTCRIGAEKVASWSQKHPGEKAPAAMLNEKYYFEIFET